LNVIDNSFSSRAALAPTPGSKRLMPKSFRHFSFAAIVATACAPQALRADPPSTNAPPDAPVSTGAASLKEPAGAEQWWNWHAQNTDIVQFQPSFPANYSGKNSLINSDEARETVSIDILAGVRLWNGAEFHVDGLMWQGYGLSKTLGIAGFPNAEAYRVGVTIPNVNISRAFIRQVIGLGGEQETVEDDALHLAGKEDVSRITLTAGKMSAHDIFDNNRYANDPRTQFMNWGLTADLAWDYPADSIGYITGFAAELNQPKWTLRYGFFQVPEVSNGLGVDESVTRAWGMVTEFERRFSVADHPGAARLLTYVNRAHMGDYQVAVNQDGGGVPDLVSTRDYRYKYGICLNLEQEVFKGVGVFTRLGWSDGKNEAWAYDDADESASAGVSINGAFWTRPNDTIGLAGILNGISKSHQAYLAAGGVGILAGDGALNYGVEQVMEVYYDFQIFKTLHGAVDYQYIANPAFNQDRGPVSVISGRLHWDF
jgi:high affinity Mn2+ porin